MLNPNSIRNPPFYIVSLELMPVSNTKITSPIFLELFTARNHSKNFGLVDMCMCSYYETHTHIHIMQSVASLESWIYALFPSDITNNNYQHILLVSSPELINCVLNYFLFLLVLSFCCWIPVDLLLTFDSGAPRPVVMSLLIDLNLNFYNPILLLIVYYVKHRSDITIYIWSCSIL